MWVWGDRLQGVDDARNAALVGEVDALKRVGLESAFVRDCRVHGQREKVELDGAVRQRK